MDTKIILIVGASGVGKDTLINAAQKELGKEFNFVKRYVTRQSDMNEKNYFLDEEAFKVLQDNNFFISSWNAHKNSYGISKNSITNKINVISISRSRIKEFEDLFHNVYTINIVLNKNELRRRLILRNRESLESIEKRLNRTYLNIEAKNIVEFDNSSKVEISTKKFIDLLKKISDV